MQNKNVDDTLRGIAGLFILISLALGAWVHPGWYLFTAFVGANLLQSAFTGWCPMMALLRRAGLPGRPGVGIPQPAVQRRPMPSGGGAREWERLR